MKTAVGLFAFVLCSSLTTTAQIVPKGGCGCSVSSSGQTCDCLSAGGASKQSVPSERSQLIETWITLSPDALLTKGIPGDDEVFIGMGSGELANEAKSPPGDVPISEGSLFLMPKDEPYRLRNVGKQDVKVRVIRIHHTGPASQ